MFRYLATACVAAVAQAMTPEQIQAVAQKWYTEEAVPMFHAHAAEVAQSAIAKQQMNNTFVGQAECAEQQDCYDDHKQDIIDDLLGSWKEILTTFRRDVRSLYLETTGDITDKWSNLDNLCPADEVCPCGVDPAVIENLYKQIQKLKEDIAVNEAEIDLIEEKMGEIEETCPEEIVVVVV